MSHWESKIFQPDVFYLALGGSSLQEFFLCFSFIKNTKAVLRTDVADGAITSLNGIRVISITWVIMGHCLVFSLPDIGMWNITSFYIILSD